MLKIFKEHQKIMFKYMVLTIHCFLVIPMRFGKTLVVVRRVKTYSKCKHVLVVAPYAAFLSWEKEVNDENQGQIIEIIGKTTERKALVDSKWDTHRWYIASKETNLWAPEVLTMDWDVVIFDESTFIKNPKSKISKFALKNFRDVNHRICLTGTPDPGGPMDFFCQLKFLSENYLSMYRDFWHFRAKAFDEVDFTYDYELNKNGANNLYTCLAQNVLMMTREDAGIVDERVQQPRYLKLPPKLQTIYNKIEKEFALSTPESEDVLTKFATRRHEWLKQLCNGFIEDDLVYPAKLNEIKYLLNTELRGQKVIICATRSKYLLMLQKELRKKYKVALVHGKTKKSKRKNIFINFQKGKYDLLIANPIVIQYGLDFSISSTLIHYDLCDMETMLQVDERLFHMDKKESLLYLFPLVKGSIEDDYYKGRVEGLSDMRILREHVKRIRNKYAKKVA